MCMKKRTAGQFASRFLLNFSSGAGGPSASFSVSLTRTIAAVALEVGGDTFLNYFRLILTVLNS